MLHDAPELFRSNEKIKTLRRTADLDVGSPADDPDGLPHPLTLGDPRRGVSNRIGHEHSFRQDASDRVEGNAHTRSASPETSAECGR